MENFVAEWRQYKDTIYSVSNTGLVRNNKRNRILFPGIDSAGYQIVNLRINGESIIHAVHILVAIVYKNFVPDGKNLIVHHNDGNKSNNYDWNLKIITFRANCSIERTLKSSSKYVGVCWCKRSNKWIARIRINSKSKYLGSFKKEIDAHNAYQLALKSL